MSQHSKCSVAVVSSTGKSWTTRRGARRLVERNLAEAQPDGTIRMLERDPRFDCRPAAAHVPNLVVMPLRPMPAFRASLYFEGFLPYPQATQTSVARGLRGKYPALARKAA